jgi:excisionase family DNA binding protein
MTHLLNTQELSQYLNISARKVQYLKAHTVKPMPFIQIGRAIRFDLEEVMAFLKNNQQLGVVL